MKELRKILRELRVDHDLKQETVANYLGIEQQSYSNYENPQNISCLGHAKACGYGEII